MEARNLVSHMRERGRSNSDNRCKQILQKGTEDGTEQEMHRLY